MRTIRYIFQGISHAASLLSRRMQEASRSQRSEPSAGGAAIEQLECRRLLSAAHLISLARLKIPASAKAHPDFQSFAKPNNGGSTVPGGITPSEMRGAYGVGNILFGSVVGQGNGQTIAIVDAYDYPSALSDLNAFSSYYRLPTFNGGTGSPTFTKYNENGAASPLPGADPAGQDNDDWEIEEALDIEWAHSIAPEANIDLVEGNTNYNTDLFAADVTAAGLPGVSAVSNSWSEDEYSGETSTDSIFNQTGVTFLYSTGDDGAAGGPQYPACSPNVVAVGGTTLTLGASNTYGSESAWNYGGGGISQYESIPSYQLGNVNNLSSTQRTEPDISMDADPNTGVPIYDSYDFGVSTPWIAGYEGGTSLSCPMCAGLIAIANQGRAIDGLSALTGATQTLPDLYNLPSADFHDITTGNNGYAAGTGYDLATGIGTPVANLLVTALSPAFVTTAPVSQTVAIGQDAKFTAAATGAASVQWMVAPAGSNTFSPVASGGTSTTLDLGAATAGESGNRYEAVFSNLSGTTTTSAATLYVDPAWLSSSSAATWNAGTQILTVTGATSIIADPGSDEPVIQASGGSSVVTINPSTGTDIHIGGLSLTSGAYATVKSLGTARTINNYRLLVIGVPGASVAPTYTIDSTSTLNLADNDMAILYGNGTSPLPSVAAELSEAYDNKSWDKPGLTSSNAKALGGATALGFGEASTLGLSTFDGLALGGNAVLVKYTLTGDTNLDGSVNLADYNTVVSNFNSSGQTWTSGSFDYTGKVGLTDYNDVIGDFNQNLANLLT